MVLAPADGLSEGVASGFNGTCCIWDCDATGEEDRELEAFVGPARGQSDFRCD